MRSVRAWIIAGFVVLAVSSIGCVFSGESEEAQLERIRASNEAARSGAAVETTSELEPLSVSVLDIRVGDCVSSASFEGEQTEMRIVPCEGDWSHIAIDAIRIADTEPFPGDASILQIADFQCDLNTTDTLAPTPGSWEVGDRVIVCFASRDSLEVGRSGECFSDGVIETATRVPCAEPHTAEVYHVALYPGASVYPGDDAMFRFAEEACFQAFEPYVGAQYADSAAFFDLFAPTSATWSLADDTRVLCFLTSEDYSPLTGSFRDSGR